MAKKFVVYVTHGVYVDTPDGVDPEQEEDYWKIARVAVDSVLGKSFDELVTESTYEIEDVTEEFEED